MNRIALMLGIVLSAGWLEAQTDTLKKIDPIATDRPDITESAFLVPKGYFQMEIGCSIEDTDPGFIYTYPTILWKYGVNHNVEIRVLTEYTRIQKQPDPDIRGFQPLEVGLKAKLTEQRGIFPKASLIGHMKFPGIVTEEMQTTYFAPSLVLAFNHTVSRFFSISYNGGIEWDGENAEPCLLYSLSTAFTIGHFGLFVEGYGETPQRDDSPLEFRIDAGLTFLIGNDFQFDVSAGQGLTDNAPERFISAGLSYRIRL